MYKPPVKRNTGSLLQVKAQVEVHPKKPLVRLHLEDGEWIVLNKADCPQVVVNGDFYVTLSEDKQKMFSLKPIEGLFVCQVSRFSAKPGEPPVPKTFQGDKWSYQYFVVMLQIIEGNLKGIEIPYSLRYYFADVDGEVGLSHPGSKYHPLLAEFLEITGVWEKGPIKYQDNILPVLEKRILAQRRKFNVLVKDGWVDKIFVLKVEKPEPDIIDNEDLAPDPEPEPEAWDGE